MSTDHTTLPGATPPAPTVKKTRALPKVWTRYWNLAIGDRFFIGRKPLNVVGCFFYEDEAGNLTFIWPWTRVQTNVLVRDARPGGKSSRYPGSEAAGHACVVGEPEAARQRIEAVVEECEKIEHSPFKTGDGTTTEQDEAYFARQAPKQPTSDNKIGGPTS